MQRCALRHGMEQWWMTLAYGPKWWDILMRAPSHPESKELRLQSRKGSPKPLPPNFVCWLGTLVVGSGASNPGIIGHSGATTCLQPSGTASSGGAADAYTGKADSYVPTFNGKQSDYREYRRRCDIYQMKMKLANREKETVFNLVTLFQGRAWDCVEDLTVEDLAQPEAYATVFERLDAAFKFDAMTELPSDFESYFVKMQRKNGQTLQEYQAEYLHTERRLTMVHKIELPEKIRAWWFLRRSGLTRDQRQLILTQLGDSNLTLDKAVKAMNFIMARTARWTELHHDGTKVQPRTRPMPTWQRMMKHGLMTRSTWSGMTMRLKVTRCWMVTRRL